MNKYLNKFAWHMLIKLFTLLANIMYQIELKCKECGKQTSHRIQDKSFTHSNSNG